MAPSPSRKSSFPTSAASRRNFRAAMFRSAIACAIWFAAIGGGMLYLTAYSATPGTAADLRPGWPPTSVLPRTPGLPSLLLFAHPECPCSRASVTELGRLLRSIPGRVDAFVVLSGPGPLAALADELPGAQVIVDTGSPSQAELFGAKTSGQVFLYDAGGRLAFEGGITPARGHEGDSEGRDAILSYLLASRRGPAGEPPTARAQTLHARVFGCALGHHPETQARVGRQTP